MSHPDFDGVGIWTVFIDTGSMQWHATDPQPLVVPLPGQIFYHPMGCLCRCDSITSYEGNSLIIKATVLRDRKAIDVAILKGY